MAATGNRLSISLPPLVCSLPHSGSTPVTQPTVRQEERGLKGQKSSGEEGTRRAGSRAWRRRRESKRRKRRRKTEAKGKNEVRRSWPLLRYSPFSSSSLSPVSPPSLPQHLPAPSGILALSKFAFVLLRSSVSSHNFGLQSAGTSERVRSLSRGTCSPRKRPLQQPTLTITPHAGIQGLLRPGRALHTPGFKHRPGKLLWSRRPAHPTFPLTGVSKTKE